MAPTSASSPTMTHSTTALKWALALLLRHTPVALGYGPEQRSLALTSGGPSEMSVTWASLQPWSTNATGQVSWWSANNSTNKQSAPALTSTYTAGFGWTGSLYQATMTGLRPGAWYNYTVESESNVSDARQFRAAPAAGSQGSVKIAVLGDMGTIQLTGFMTAAAVIKEHAASPFDMILIAGDLSYATVDPPNDEIEGFWDSWSQQNEPFASTAPFLMSVGNHESTPGNLTNASGTFPQPFAAFSARYKMPANGYANFWFSYSYGQAYFVSMDTEEDYDQGSPQWQWVDTTLASVNRTTFPWLFLVLHRPIISADSDEEGSHIPGGELSRALEPLTLKYKVDVVLQGHQHVYERSAAQFNGTVIALPNANGTYTNPGAPIYIVQGTSGAVLDYDKWIVPTPSWSLIRQSVNGYGRMSLTRDSEHLELAYEFVDVDGIVQDRWSIMKE